MAFAYQKPATSSKDHCLEHTWHLILCRNEQRIITDRKMIFSLLAVVFHDAKHANSLSLSLFVASQEPWQTKKSELKSPRVEFWALRSWLWPMQMSRWLSAPVKRWAMLQHGATKSLKMVEMLSTFYKTLSCQQCPASPASLGARELSTLVQLPGLLPESRNTRAKKS